MVTPPTEGKRHAVVYCTSPGDCTPLREGGAVLLALPVGVEPLEEGQSGFYQGPRVKEQSMVALLYPYVTVLLGGLPLGETHWGSQHPHKKGIRGELTRVAHDISILTEGCETFAPLEICYVLTRCL